MVRSRSHVFIVFAAAVAGSLLYFYFDPSFHFFPPCPFHFLTGYFCPGCGSQRAFHELLHGNIIRAAGYNILFVLFLPLIAYAAAVSVNNIFSKKKIGQRIFNSTVFVRVVLAVVLLFWMLRNIPVYPFNWLAP